MHEVGFPELFFLFRHSSGQLHLLLEPLLYFKTDRIFFFVFTGLNRHRYFLMMILSGGSVSLNQHLTDREGRLSDNPHLLDRLLHGPSF